MPEARDPLLPSAAMVGEAVAVEGPKVLESTQPRIQARALMLSVVVEAVATQTPSMEVPLMDKLQQRHPAAEEEGHGPLVPPSEWAERVLLGKLS